MNLKLNVRPEIAEEMEELYALSGARSKTEYINMAIAELNRKQRRRLEVERLKDYFVNPQHLKEEEESLSEFAALREDKQ